MKSVNTEVEYTLAVNPLLFTGFAPTKRLLGDDVKPVTTTVGVDLNFSLNVTAVCPTELADETETFVAPYSMWGAESYAASIQAISSMLLPLNSPVVTSNSVTLLCLSRLCSQTLCAAL